MQIMFQDKPAIQLHPADDVAIALIPLGSGRPLSIGEHALRLSTAIGAGHKIALRSIEIGQPVRRYGQVIGFATRAIAPGDHVHSHNLAVGEMQLDYHIGSDLRAIDYLPEAERRTFQGYRREQGRAGTRNTIVIIATVNCSAHTIRRLAASARDELLPRFSNVTDIVALTHKNGCGTRDGSPELDLLQRTLAGFARNPNVAGYLFVGLGCEVNQFTSLLMAQGAESGEQPALHGYNGSGIPNYIGIQDTGGIQATIAEGMRALGPLLERANTYQRQPVPISDLCVALQCGGSDGFSGISANPALGHAVDLLVQQGGTAVLAETPEVYGAEHLLTRRAVSQAVGEKLIRQIHWWEDYTARHGFEIDNNPAPGNKAGGLTTIFEKSLGAVAKGGSMPLAAVYDYAEPIDTHGFTFMDSPGYDPVSVTGQVAGGCNIIAFTTGRGSCFGFRPVPSIKISTNTTTYERMRDDMDIDAGRILGGASVEAIGTEIFEKLIAVASGEHSLSEAQGVGEEEFNPWIQGATM